MEEEVGELGFDAGLLGLESPLFHGEAASRVSGNRPHFPGRVSSSPENAKQVSYHRPLSGSKDFLSDYFITYCQPRLGHNDPRHLGESSLVCEAYSFAKCNFIHSGTW